jgi:hypothetical protein
MCLYLYLRLPAAVTMMIATMSMMIAVVAEAAATTMMLPSTTMVGASMQEVGLVVLETAAMRLLDGIVVDVIALPREDLIADS